MNYEIKCEIKIKIFSSISVSHFNSFFNKINITKTKHLAWNVTKIKGIFKGKNIV